MPSLNNTTDSRASGYPRREYITTSAFNNDLLTYTSSRSVTGVVTGTLTPVTGGTAANCPANRILRENGRRLYKDATVGVNTLLVGVYDSISGLSGVIDPNSPRFAMYNGDRSVFLDNGVDPVTGLVDQGPPIYTRGTVTAGSGLFVNAGDAITAVVTAASAANGVVTYTATNTFSAGELVSVTGLSTSAFNLTNVFIATATSALFTVSNPATGTAVTGANGLASIGQTTLVVPNNVLGTVASGSVLSVSFTATVSNVTYVSGTGVVTYTVANTFTAGQSVTVSGITGATTANVTNALIISASSTAFTVVIAQGISFGTPAGTAVATVTVAGMNVTAGGLAVNAGSTSTSASISNTSVAYNSTTGVQTYTVSNSFIAGQLVTVSGFTGTDAAAVNIRGVIATASPTAFTINVATGLATTATATLVGTGTAVATQPSLTVTSANTTVNNGLVAAGGLNVFSSPATAIASATSIVNYSASQSLYTVANSSATTTIVITTSFPAVGAVFYIAITQSTAALTGVLVTGATGTYAACGAGPIGLVLCTVVRVT